MTFTEAAIEVLRREGKPLHFRTITEIAVRESLLDHVGKVPEETMADQLSAHGRLPRVERRVIPVQPGTFALAEWGIDEDPAGLENLVEPPPEDELAYRGRERHPVPSREIARGLGRGEGVRARRREDEERRGRRFPPPSEVAYEILAGAGRPLSLVEIAVAGAERLLMPDAFVREPSSLEAALSEDNRRRESAGRKPLFRIADAVTLVAQPEPGERVAAPTPARAGPGDARRSALAALRRRLRDCDGPTTEHVAVRLLEKLGFRDLKVAKRGREHVIYTGRRRMGLSDVRHGVRIIRSGADAGRRDVSDVRRDLGHYGAQIGLVVTAGDAVREARGEAGAAGQLPVVLLCGEALAEALADAGVGCVPVVVPEVDEAFFRSAAETAEKEEAARRARREERERRDGARREEQARPPGGVEPSEAPASAAGEAAPPEPAAPSPVGDEDVEEGDEAEEEGTEAGTEAQPGSAAAVGAPAEDASGDRRRRRRRRRRRGGRGRAREGSPPGAEGSKAQTSEAARAEGSAETNPEKPPPTGRTPGDDDGGTQAP